MVADTLVDALVMTCKDDEIALQREFVGDMLVEAFAVGRREDHLVVVALGFQGCDAAVNGLALHHHTGTSAIGVVVYAAPFVEGVVTQVVQMDLCQSFFLCPCQDRLVYESFEHLGQHGDDIYSHL